MLMLTWAPPTGISFGEIFRIQLSRGVTATSPLAAKTVVNTDCMDGIAVEPGSMESSDPDATRQVIYSVDYLDVNGASILNVADALIDRTVIDTTTFTRITGFFCKPDGVAWPWRRVEFANDWTRGPANFRRIFRANSRGLFDIWWPSHCRTVTWGEGDVSEFDVVVPKSASPVPFHDLQARGVERPRERRGRGF